MSKKNIPYIITIFLSFVVVIIINTNMFNDIHFMSNPVFNYTSEFGDYLVVQNLYNNRNFSVPKYIKINASNYKLGDFILLSQLINNQTKKAVLNANNLFSIDHNNIYAISVILMDHIKNKEFEKIDDFLEKIKITKKNNLFLTLIDVWLKMAQGFVDEAFGTLDNMKIDPEFEDIYYVQKGMMCEVDEDFECAAANYEHSLNERVSLRTVELLVKLHIRNKNYSSARYVMQKYNHLRPESDMGFALKKYIDKMESSKKIPLKKISYIDGFAEIFFDLGFIKQLELNFDQSMLFSKIAILLNQNLDFGKLTLVNLLSNTNKKPMVVDILKSIKKDSYLYEPTQGYIAEALYLMEKYDEALTIYKKLINNKGSNLNYYVNATQIYELKHEFKKALELYNFVFSKLTNKKDPKLWGLYFKRGILYYNMKNLNLAERDLRMAVKLAPNNPVLLNYLGYILVDNDTNVQNALNMLEKAFVLSLNKLPMDKDLLKYLGQLVLNNAKLTKEMIGKRNINRFDNNSNYIDSLGWALYKNRQYKLSVSLLEFGRSIDPTHPLINYHLGEAYFSVGRVYEAVYSWKKALFYDKYESKLENTNEIKSKIKSSVLKY